MGLADGADPSSYSGKIIECSWDSEEDVWVCMRVRTDKGTPNEFNTYKKVYSVSYCLPILILVSWKCYNTQHLLFQNWKQVMRSIRDNITEDILLNEINEIIRLPMYADRIQNESKAHQHNSSRRRWTILISGMHLLFRWSYNLFLDTSEYTWWCKWKYQQDNLEHCKLLVCGILSRFGTLLSDPLSQAFVLSHSHLDCRNS